MAYPTRINGSLCKIPLADQKLINYAKDRHGNCQQYLQVTLLILPRKGIPEMKVMLVVLILTLQMQQCCMLVAVCKATAADAEK